MALEIDVEWRPGPDGDPEPLILRISSRARRVDEILDRWPAPGYGYVKLRGDDGGVYIVRYDDGGACWSITFYNSGEALPGTLTGVKPRYV